MKTKTNAPADESGEEHEPETTQPTDKAIEPAEAVADAKVNAAAITTGRTILKAAGNERKAQLQAGKAIHEFVVMYKQEHPGNTDAYRILAETIHKLGGHGYEARRLREIEAYHVLYEELGGPGKAPPLPTSYYVAVESPHLSIDQKRELLNDAESGLPYDDLRAKVSHLLGGNKKPSDRTLSTEVSKLERVVMRVRDMGKQNPPTGQLLVRLRKILKDVEDALAEIPGMEET